LLTVMMAKPNGNVVQVADIEAANLPERPLSLAAEDGRRPWAIHSRAVKWQAPIAGTSQREDIHA
jgi:hypothetical protein